MYISPVNNINFNGKFKNTPVLEKLIHSSSNDTLARFSEVVERAAKVNDNCIYDFSKTRFIDFVKHTATTSFELCKQQKGAPKRTLEHAIAREENKQGSLSLDGILTEFLPILEKKYPKENLESRVNIIEKITKNLI